MRASGSVGLGSPQTKTLTGVLLAGGESRRMGTDKASIVLAGQPIWERQLALLRELPVSALWVSARARPLWCPSSIGTVLDVPPSRGPLSGLAASIRRLRTTHVLVLAVDLPHMSAAHLRRLWLAVRPGCGIVPLNKSFYEPLCAVYPREAAPTFIRALKNSNSRLQPVVADLVEQGLLRACPLSRSEEKLYQNVNSPADLLQIRTRRD
jgi:molybdopterin-guanine dinucleotide biosynthesis protein A